MNYPKFFASRSYQSIFRVVVLLIFSGLPTTTAADGIKKDQELAAKGMELVEAWEGDGGKLDEAQNLFDQALKLNSKNVEALTGLGRVEMRRGYISGDRFKKESLTTALKYANKALSLDPKHLKAHFLKSMLLSAMGHYDSALGEADIIQNIDPSSCDPYSLRVNVYQYQEKLKEAIKEGLKELSCPGTNENKIKKRRALEGLAVSYAKLGDYENAVPYYKQIVDLTQSPWAYGNYSDILTKRGELEEAEKMAKKAISIMDYPMAHRYLSEIYYQKGKICEKNGDDIEAEKLHISSIRENPTSIYPCYRLVDIYMKRGACEKAVKVAQYGLRIAPHDAYMPKILSKCSPLKK